MVKHLRTIRTAGMIISRPVAFALVIIYMIQSLALLYLIYDKYENEKTIFHQRTQIMELKEKLMLQDIIKDFQSDMGSYEIGRMAGAIYEESKKYGYDPLLLLAVIKTESEFKKSAVSNKGAMGLMQMRPSTGLDLALRRELSWTGKYDLFDPGYNVHLGSLYLFELILKFKDLRQALRAYNLGETETRHRLMSQDSLSGDYVRKVLSTYYEFKEKYEG